MSLSLIEQARRYLEENQIEQAELLCCQAVEQAPSPDAYRYWGNALLKQERWSEAIQCYESALAIDPNYALAHFNLGVAHRKQNQVEPAMVSFRAYLNLEPLDQDTWQQIGSWLTQEKYWSEAVQHYQQALQHFPQNLDFLISLGYALNKVGQFTHAIEIYERVFSLEPAIANQPAVQVGRQWQQQRKFEAASQSYQEAIRQHQIQEQFQLYQNLVQQEPDEPSHYFNLALIWHGQGNLPEAIACYEKLLHIQPDHQEAQISLGLIHLQMGDWLKGWHNYEWRKKRPELSFKTFPFPPWDGSDLQGKTILLYGEQGFGDVIQFVRYASLVKARHGRVWIGCYTPLVRLLQTVADVERVIDWHEPLPTADYQIRLLDLPHLLGTTLANVPNSVPYLQAPTSTITLTAPPNTRLKVGIAWSGNPAYVGNAQRYCPLECWQSLLEISDIAFYSLIKGNAEADLERIDPAYRPQAMGTLIQDFGDTAAVICQLDLVITIDTSIAHLAGALGRPTWLLLCHLPDWRWMLDRDDSPWYPTLRLFRQSSPGDWLTVIERVKIALMNWPE